MGRDQHDSLSRQSRQYGIKARCERRIGGDAVLGPMQRINHAVAGDMDLGGIDSLGPERGGGGFGGGEVEAAIGAIIRRFTSSGQG